MLGGIVRELVNKIGFQTDMTGAKKAENQFTRLQGMSQKLSFAMGGLLAGFSLKSSVGGLLSVTNQFEQLDVAFSTMLNSQGKANNLMQQMQNFAKVTPFTIQDVTTGAKQLLAYNFEVTEIIDEMKTLGDVASGISMPLGDLVYLYGTLRSQGRALAIDIRQFAGRGIPIYEELAKVLKVNTTQLKIMIEEGKVGFKEVQQAFKNMTSEGGKFYNLMFKQSKTIGGMWSNFKDSVTFMLKDIGEQLLPFLKSVMGSVLKIFNFLNEKISPTMKVILFAIATLTLAIIPITALISLISLELLPVYGTILAIAAGAALIGLAFDDIYTYIKGGNSIIGLWLPPFETLKKLVQSIQKIFENIGGSIANLQFGNWKGLKEDIENIKKSFSDIANNKFFLWINKQLDNLPKLRYLTPPGMIEYGAKFAMQPYLTAKRQEVESKNQLNRVNNLNTTVNITIPQGTPKQQTDYLKWSAEKYFNVELEKTSRKIIAANKEIE
jgi:hypothetical protein